MSIETLVRELPLALAVAAFKKRLHRGDVPVPTLRREVAELNVMAGEPRFDRAERRLCAAICLMAVYERVDVIGFGPVVERACESAEPDLAPGSLCWSCVRRHRCQALLAQGRLDEADELAVSSLVCLRAKRCQHGTADEAIKRSAQVGFALLRSRVACARGDGAAANRILDDDLVARGYTRDRWTWANAAVALVEMLATLGKQVTATRVGGHLLREMPRTFYAAEVSLILARSSFRRADLETSAEHARAASETAGRLGAARMEYEALVVARDAAIELGQETALHEANAVQLRARERLRRLHGRQR